jgi:hypothetical protein
VSLSRGKSAIRETAPLARKEIPHTAGVVVLVEYEIPMELEFAYLSFFSLSYYLPADSAQLGHSSLVTKNIYKKQNRLKTKSF